MGLKEHLAQMGGALARPRSINWEGRASNQLSFNVLFLLSLLTIVGAGFSEPIALFLNSTTSVTPEIGITRDQWHVLFEKGSDCSLSQSCALDNSIWTSSARLSDTDHFAKVREFEGKVFWVSLELTASQVERIRLASPVMFVVGHINAGFRIFVNGELRNMGDGRDFMPTSFAVTRSDLSPGYLRIAIQLNHNLSSARPIVVDAPYINGVFTMKAYTAYRDKWLAIQIISPLFLGLAALFSSLAFFGLWASVRDRNEYFLFALYTFCLFAIQLRLWGSVKHTMNRSSIYELDLYLRALEGLSAALVGISYSRARLSAYIVPTAFTAVILLLLSRSSTLGSDYLYLAQYVGMYFVPLGFLVGSLSCLSQGFFGVAHGFPRMNSAQVRTRVSRLFVFSALNVILGIIYFSEASKIVPIDAWGIWYRPVQFSIVATIGLFLFRDYRKFDVAQQKLALSRFHDPLKTEQDIFSGFLLAIDLKGSSALYDLSASLGLAKKIPTTWCEAATEIVEGAGGARISTSGDSLIAFFPKAPKVALQNVLQAVVCIQSSSVAELFDEKELFFRAAVIEGKIRPIYKKVFQKFQEDFEDAPGETCFKNLARILDTEKELGKKDESILVLDAHLKIECDQLLPLQTAKLPVRDVGNRELTFYRILANRLKSADVA